MSGWLRACGPGERWRVGRRGSAVPGHVLDVDAVVDWFAALAVIAISRRDSPRFPPHGALAQELVSALPSWPTFRYIR